MEEEAEGTGRVVGSRRKPSGDLQVQGKTGFLNVGVGMQVSRVSSFFFLKSVCTLYKFL